MIGLYTDSWTGGDDPSQVEFVGRNGPVKLEGKRIRYIEGSRNYQILYPVEGTPVEVKQTMDKLEARMESHGFIRIHKGYLVNYRFIQRIAYDHVILRDGTSLPVGRSKVTAIKNKFLALLED